MKIKGKSIIMEIKGKSIIMKIKGKSIKKNAERIIGVHKNEWNQCSFHDGIVNVVEEEDRFRLFTYCTFFSNDEERIKDFMDSMIHEMCPEGHIYNRVINVDFPVYAGIGIAYYETNIMK